MEVGLDTFLETNNYEIESHKQKQTHKYLFLPSILSLLFPFPSSYCYKEGSVGDNERYRYRKTETNAFRRPHAIRPSRRRRRVVMSLTRTQRPTRPSPSHPTHPIRTRARPPPRPRTRRPRSATVAVDQAATRTARSVPRPPGAARAVTATARPHLDACRTVPPIGTTRTASKTEDRLTHLTLHTSTSRASVCCVRFPPLCIMPSIVTILLTHCKSF